MAVVGEATIKLNYDGKDAKLSLAKTESDAKNTFSKIGGVAKGTGKVIGLALSAGYAATQAIIGKIATDAVSLYSDYEQLAGGIETLFKDSSNVVMEYAQDAYKTAGLSANQYMEQASSFASRLIRDTGGNTKKAAELADLAIKDMSDNANKMGTDIQSIQNAYQGLAKGNATMLDNLKIGYGGTQTEMLKLAKDMGVIDKNVKSFNDVSFEDAILAIHKVQEKLGITGTTAEEAGSTIQGSLTSVKAAWENLLTGLGQEGADLDKLIDNVIVGIFGDGEKNKGVLGNLMPVFERAIKGISKALPKLTNELVSRLPSVLQTILPALIEATVAVFVALAQAFPQFLPLIVDGLVTLINALIPYMPSILGALFSAIIQLVVGLLGSIGNYLGPWLESVAQSVWNWFNGIFKQIGVFFSDFSAKAVEFIDGFVQGFKKGIENIKNFFASIPGFFAGVVGKITDKVKQFGTKVGEVVGGAFKAVVNGVLRFIENFINAPIRAINGLIDTINNVPGIDLGRLNEFHLPRLAKGGLATGSTLANIGEAGDEAVIPLERNIDRWAIPMAKALADQFAEQTNGNGITVYMTNQINNNLDADEIGQRLMTSIRRAA